jgi:hypothetical protein
MAKMKRTRKVNGFSFEWDEENSQYACRGDVYYDEEHDEVPEPKLWIASNKLEAILKEEGYDAEACYSEKGWQEVEIYQTEKG